MTSITRNLPWFIRDPAVTLIGEKCYISLVENLHLGDADCLKYALSKGVGLGIVVGGSIVKVPQVLIILSARSARGLSLTAYVLETLAYAITLAYSFRNEFPFSTYGENLFLSLQDAIITVLIVYFPSTAYQRSKGNTGQAAVAGLAILASSYILSTVPTSTLALLQVATLPLSVFSKLPQIVENHRAQSTGQLSAFAVGSQIAGCLARLFTTSTEVGDVILFLGFAVALVLNCVLGVQMWLYWNEVGDVRVKAADLVDEKDTGRVDVVVPPSSPPPIEARRWARKRD